MSLAIMQPYFFPYIGYFQLMNTVDHFLIHDDVQWIKGGWINRNRISVHGHEQLLTLPVESSGSMGLICHRRLAPDFEQQRQRMARLLREAYQRAPYYEQVADLFSRCLNVDMRSVSELVVRSLKLTGEYLGIQTPILLSSGLAKDESLKGETRVLELCRLMQTDHYVNPIGGTELYSRERFQQNGIRLSFLKPHLAEYRQLRLPFMPGLSILDVMMFNSPTEIRELLTRSELV